MKSRNLVVLAITVFLVIANVCPAQDSAPMKNDDVIQMVGSGLSDDAVIDLIHSSSTEFDLSTKGLAALKKAKVSAKVLAAMKAAEASRQAAAKAVAASPAPISPLAPGTSKAAALPPCQPVPAPVVASQPAPNVSLIAGGNTLPLPGTLTQIAQSNTPMAGSFGTTPNAQSLQKLATSNLNFASFSSKALMFVPQVAVATKLIGAIHHTSKPAGSTVALALPGAHAAAAAPAISPIFDVQYGNVTGLNPDEYQPALVQLTPSANNFRLVGARQVAPQANGAVQQSAITERRIDVKASQLDRGHVTLQPSAPLPPGEYAIVMRSVAGQVQAQSSVPASTPAAAQAAPAATVAQASPPSQVEYMAWDFSVSASSIQQQ